jgi:hypothetical protein
MYRRIGNKYFRKKKTKPAGKTNYSEKIASISLAYVSPLMPEVNPTQIPERPDRQARPRSGGLFAREVLFVIVSSIAVIKVAEN